MQCPFVCVLLVSLTSASYIPREFRKHKNFNLLYRRENCGYSMASNRIVGGEEATPGQYPWIARLGLTWYPGEPVAEEYQCAGTIISEIYILTAAHCDSTKFKWVEVRLGEHDDRKHIDCDVTGHCLPPPQDIAIRDYFCHPKFDRISKQNDICIIRLAWPIKFGESVQPICLPFYKRIIQDYLPWGTNLEVAGWGHYKPGHKQLSNVLLRLTVPAVDMEICKSLIYKLSGNKTVITRQQICAGGRLGKDSCHGDSGGPLMKAYSLQDTPRYFLLGVVSFGQNNCGGSEFPAIYTDVRRYMKWILDKLPTSQRRKYNF